MTEGDTMTETKTTPARGEAPSANGTEPELSVWDRLRAPFPPELVGQLPRKNNRTGAVTMLDFVGHGHVTDRLLSVDPTWTWEPVAFGPDGFPALVRDGSGRPVGLWIRLSVHGVTRLGYGSVAPDAFDPEKQLIGDALRNAAMRFGVALDCWRHGAAEDEPEAVASVPCPKCGMPLRERTGPRGAFVGCSSYRGKDAKGCGFAADGTLADLAASRTEAERPRGHLSDEQVAAGVGTTAAEPGRPADAGIFDTLRAAMGLATLAEVRDAFRSAGAIAHLRVVGTAPKLAATGMTTEMAADILQRIEASGEADVDLGGAY